MNAFRTRLLSLTLSKVADAGRVVMASSSRQLLTGTLRASGGPHAFHTAVVSQPPMFNSHLVFERENLKVLFPQALSSGMQMQARQLSSQKQESRDSKEKRVVAQDEDPFDTITDRIPEKPVTIAEAGSYSIVILAGLAVAAVAGYAVLKELLIEPKEYQVFNKALEKVKMDSRVVARLGGPITGYGQESRNRSARQRISNNVWKDEDGVERIQIQFHVRGPHGAGLVHCEMFRDKEDRGRLKFTYLLVDVTSPSPVRIMLESYMPQVSLGAP